MGSIFRFKRFEVDQSGCAMKINTDGVLLGALAKYNHPGYVLDIGTGTGVIALMLAQRFDTAKIDAVEIDPQAAQTARSNFNCSSFAERLHLIQGSFECIEAQDKYDLIVSNPPFYVNSLHNPNDRKKLARHTDHLFFHNLVRFSAQALKNDGILQLILPCELAVEVVDIAQADDLVLVEEVKVKSYSDTEYIRSIISLKKDGTCKQMTSSSFVIYDDRGVYSQSYRDLLSSFFLTL
ncbi:methyltransferase domain-containing protein [Sphingobacterium olei]|uniref:tRNA1(Val) (adenine(37)-N6)-methyltransferase n=1 Tax=Sphingobacterium olei TaxID=2571155 RepID=A0A4U0P0W6_9SPHI|nr:methyltransferase [Sphingobacterium olei]TJZ60680.1 methyltransferase domain-containing protein [Sphingobacterium olei]